MIVKYILIKKDNSKDKMEGNIFQEKFQDVFQNISKDSFEVSLDGSVYAVKYFFSNTQGNICYLHTEFNMSPEKEAEVLSEVGRRLNISKSRKEFYVAAAYDGVSEYYCEKISGTFFRCERLVRELVLTVLTKTFGAAWVDKSLIKSVREKIEDRFKDKGGINDSGFIERMLEELTLYQLEDFLFEPHNGLERNSDLEKEFNELDISVMSDQEKENWLGFFQKTPLWDDYFAKYDLGITDMRHKLAEMRDYRNKVAHSKKFTKEDYELCKESLGSFIKSLEAAIANIEKLDFEQIDRRIVLKTLTGARAEILPKINLEDYQEFMQTMENISIQIKDKMAGVEDTLKKFDFQVQDSIMESFEQLNRNCDNAVRSINTEVLDQITRTSRSIAQSIRL